MEAVRDLSLNNSGFQSKGVKAHTGFEPVSSEIDLPAPIRSKLDELRAKSAKDVPR